MGCRLTIAFKSLDDISRTERRPYGRAMIGSASFGSRTDFIHTPDDWAPEYGNTFASVVRPWLALRPGPSFPCIILLCPCLPPQKLCGPGLLRQRNGGHWQPSNRPGFESILEDV